MIAAMLLTDCQLGFDEREPDTGPKDGGPTEGGATDANVAPCAPEGSPCGPALDCSRFVKGMVREGDRSICASGSGVIQGSCGSDGICRAAAPRDCAEMPQGVRLSHCSSTCVRSDHACLPGAEVGAISLTSMCALSTRTSSCSGPVCVEEAFTSSVTAATLIDRACDQFGTCTSTATDCNNYRCTSDHKSCKTSCSAQDDCIVNVPCAGSTCIL